MVEQNGRNEIDTETVILLEKYDAKIKDVGNRMEFNDM